MRVRLFEFGWIWLVLLLATLTGESAPLNNASMSVPAMPTKPDASSQMANFGTPITHHYTPRDYKLDATLLSMSLVGNELLIAAENGLMTHSAGYFEIQENTRHLPITSQDSCDSKRIYAGTSRRQPSLVDRVSPRHRLFRNEPYNFCRQRRPAGKAC
jgi:hypothetical protein